MGEEQKNRRPDSMEVDLQALLSVYLRRWWLIALCLVTVAALSFGITYNFVTPMYRANVSIYVNNSRNNNEVNYVTSADLSASQRLVATYISIVKSNRVLEQAAASEELDGDYSAAELNQMLSAEQVGETEIFRVYITHENPREAARIANVLADVAPEEISELIEGSSARVIDYAKVPAKAYTPNYQRNTLLGGAVGALLAVVYLTLAYLLDTHIKGEEELEHFSVPILGRIPSFNSLNTAKSDYESPREAKNVTEEG